MKSPVTVLLLLGLSFGCSAAFAGEAKPDSYATAVTSYITAAGQQLGAIRAELEAETKGATDAVKQKYAGVYAGLERTEKELEQLRAAKPADFDRRKAEFESTRDKMLRMIEVARYPAKSHP
jgi:hypothetical protein